MLINYLKIALKVLGRRKFFTFISLFGITLTLVVLMVAAAILDNAFAPQQPESRFDRVLGVYMISMRGPHWTSTSNPGFKFVDQYVKDLPGAEATSIFTGSSPMVVYHERRKIETHLRRTDGNYWRILDFKFLEGGPFTAEDDRNANFVAVITDDMRERFYGPNAKALGKTFTIDGQRFRVVGVVPAVPITRRAGFSEIWTPVRTIKGQYQQELIGNFSAIVLAHSKSDFPALRSVFAQRLANFKFDDPKNFNRVIAGLDTTFEATARNILGNTDDVNRPLVLRLIIVGVALLFITLPTVNLVSINLSRIMERASEIGVRKAFGASSRKLIGQFVMENVVLTAIGGAIAFVLATWILSVISRAQFVPYATFEVNFRIFGYGLLLAAFFGIVSGVYPAWRMSRMHPVNALRGGAQ
ncbi:MAG TPA: ABC transporter permease [Thermoanaerobaculia bacterium]|jgi:putative ABC transport system permease protein|nr:ABC transporter permease [Thermoanaerobaculia bacterium]